MGPWITLSSLDPRLGRSENQIDTISGNFLLYILFTYGVKLILKEGVVNCF